MEKNDMMNDKDIKEFHDLDRLKQYQPLPSGLTVADSGIAGQGLFTTRRLVMGTALGISHYRINGEYIRTPLGGFINHSDTPNCVKSSFLLTRQQWNHLSDLPDEKYNHNFKQWNLLTIKNIKEGEELTLKYTFYKI